MHVRRREEYVTDFTSKIVVVTGAGVGIGRAAAIAFAQHGAAVVINSLSTSGRAVCDFIQENGQSSIFVQADVSRNEGAKQVIEEAVRQYGGLDVLVNVAGIVVSGSVEDCTEEEWDQSMATYAKSVFLTSKYALPELRKSKGTIVNITSTVSIKGVTNRAAYSATKGAVLALSKSMAAEYAAEGIRVNCVCPGTVLTPSLLSRIREEPDPDQALKKYIARQPMGRLGDPEEIAQAILFAASPDVSFMTGANIVVDGAMSV